MKVYLAVFTLLALLLVTDVQAVDSLYIQGADAVGWFDAGIRQNSPYTWRNWGGHSDLVVTAQAGAVRNVLCKFTNIDTIGTGKRITGIYFDYWCETENDMSIFLKQMWKDWYEGAGTGADSVAGACNWSQWFQVFGSTDSAWGTAGAANESDAGSENRLSGSGYDRKASYVCSVLVADTGQFIPFPGDTAWANAAYKGDFGSLNWILMTPTTGTISTIFTSSEEATYTAKLPRIRIYYEDSTATPAATSARRRILEQTTD